MDIYDTEAKASCEDEYCDVGVWVKEPNLRIEEAELIKLFNAAYKKGYLTANELFDKPSTNLLRVLYKALLDDDA